jgi:putative tricarboxylic transport membrane protein
VETIIDNVFLALPVFFDPWNILLLVGGVFVGLIVGAIPGFTVTMALILFLPFTFDLSAASGLTTMLGILVGGMSGGLVGAMLTGIPGTPAAIATTFDGFPMARKGKLGLALGLGVWASFFGGVIGSIILVVLAPTISSIGLEFGPWDYFNLIIFALTIAASLSEKRLSKGLVAAGIGLLASTVGTDPINAVPRLVMGIEPLKHGFQVLPVMVGLFAFAQLMSDVENTDRARQSIAFDSDKTIKIEHGAAIREIMKQWFNVVRSSFIGVFVGAIPAIGAQVSNILAWDQAQKSSKHPEKFRTGTPEGVVAPEAANNATGGGTLAILMALGIPGDVVTIVMLGALLIHDVVPSPSFIEEHPEIAYTVFLAFFLAHFVMVALQSVGLRVFALVAKVPMYIVAAIILFCTAIGVYIWSNSIFDIWTVFLFGLLGYTMRVLGFPVAPLILGSVLGPIAELNLNRAVSTSNDLALFITRPWALFFLTMAVFSALFPLYQKWRGKRRWTLCYTPAMYIAASLPLVLMGGWFRPMVGVLLVFFGLRALYRHHQSGWELAPTPGSADERQDVLNT